MEKVRVLFIAAALTALSPDARGQAQTNHNYWDWDNAEMAFTISLIGDFVLADLTTDLESNRLDVLKMLRNYGREDASRYHGDMDDDGAVVLGDLAILQQELFGAESVAAAAVPEPSTLVLALCIMLTAAVRSGSLRHGHAVIIVPGERSISPQCAGDCHARSRGYGMKFYLKVSGLPLH